MPENHTDDRAQRRPLGYALNVFPYHALAELWTCLEGEVVQIKERVFPNEIFPIELRFSEQIVRELLNDCAEVARLKHFLDTNDLALVTVNGFVMPPFHGERVKERVYLPAWHESNARVRFTNACLDLLALFAPPDAEFVSVSVPFGALKPVPMDAIAPNILRCAEHAAKLEQRTGMRCVVALEPEPGLTVETTTEAVEFFERFVPATTRAHLAVNFDLSHQFVEFEDFGASISLLHEHGVPIAKIHVSNAAELITLKPFYEDSIYLHQVCGVNARGERAYFSLDWPTDPPPTDITRFRVHYHLPVCPQPDSQVKTALPEVEKFLTSRSLALGPSVPFIIETYTWPEQLRRRDALVENICQELLWVHEKISLCAT
jgi:sugar phosphate isomerase/epimerase